MSDDDYFRCADCGKKLGRIDLTTGVEITLEEQVLSLEKDIRRIEMNCQNLSAIVWKLVNQLNEHIEDNKI